MSEYKSIWIHVYETEQVYLSPNMPIVFTLQE